MASDLQIRPTKLPYPDLWSLDGALAFVSNAIEYEPVENPLHPPEHLLSPQSVLGFQAGDSFDLSCLLVSILTGCGFDAYVTVGYAPTDVVQNDQTKQVISRQPLSHEPEQYLSCLATLCICFTFTFASFSRACETYATILAPVKLETHMFAFRYVLSWSMKHSSRPQQRLQVAQSRLRLRNLSSSVILYLMKCTLALTNTLGFSNMCSHCLCDVGNKTGQDRHVHGHETKTLHHFWIHPKLQGIIF